MDFTLSEEQLMMKKSVDEFAKGERLKEYARYCDKNEVYPQEIIDKMAIQGWLGMLVPVEYGGAGASTLDTVIVMECLSYHMLAIGQAFYSMFILAQEAISRLGTEEQKFKYLPGSAKGQLQIAFALTEPEAGSDAASLKTEAVLKGNYFVVNGQKTLITGMDHADYVIVAVRTDKSRPKHEGITLLIVDCKTPGLQTSRIKKVGLRALDLNHVFFDDVRVPRTNVLSEVNKGWQALYAGLANERCYLAACCVGAAQAVTDDAISYAKERKQFGQPIGTFQMIKQKLVDMQVAVDCARLLTYRSAYPTVLGKPSMRDMAMAKLVASETYHRVAYEGLHIFGGYGFTEDYDMQRHVRDSQLYPIGGGTSEIQRLLIGRELGL